MREPLEFYSLLPKLKQGASIQKTPHAIPACRKFRLRLQLAEHGRLIPRNFVSTRGERRRIAENSGRKIDEPCKRESAHVFSRNFIEPDCSTCAFSRFPEKENRQVK